MTVTPRAATRARMRRYGEFKFGQNMSRNVYFR
jgi:hypothetical protein